MNRSTTLVECLTWGSMLNRSLTLRPTVVMDSAWFPPATANHIPILSHLVRTLTTAPFTYKRSHNFNDFFKGYWHCCLSGVVKIKNASNLWSSKFYPNHHSFTFIKKLFESFNKRYHMPTCSLIPKSLYWGLGLSLIHSEGILGWWSRHVIPHFEALKKFL